MLDKRDYFLLEISDSNTPADVQWKAASKIEKDKKPRSFKIIQDQISKIWVGSISFASISSFLTFLGMTNMAVHQQTELTHKTQHKERDLWANFNVKYSANETTEKNLYRISN